MTLGALAPALVAVPNLQGSLAHVGKAVAEAATPKPICTETGMPSGTVNPKLRELRRYRLVSQTELSEYYVAPHQVAQAIQRLHGEQE